MIENLENNTNLQLALNGVIPQILRLGERSGLKLLAERTIYRACEEFQPEYGYSFWQKAKYLLWCVQRIKPERIGILQGDLFAALTEREKAKIPFGAWVERFFRIVGEITALAVSDKREMIRLKMAELVILSEMEFV